jgi:hypothetical protein
MTSERAKAYGRVMKTLADLSGAKLHAPEQEQIREAADALFFCESLDADAQAREALAGIEELAARLVEGDRFSPEAATRLVADVDRCGPLAVPAAS